MPARSRPAPTLDTVAAEAGVSRQTVSNALNSPHLLRADTLARVQLAIDKLGYSPNRAARNLRTRASHLIGLRLEPFIEGSASGLMDRFLHQLAESSRGSGLHVLLFTGDDHTNPLDGYDALLRSAAVDGFVVTDTYRGNPAATWLSERQVPFVAFGRPWDDADAKHPWVDVDGRAGVALAVDHLVDRGHQRIAWIGWQKNSYLGEDRRSGWVDRMHERGLSTSRLSARGDDTIDFGSRATYALLDSEQPTAFVCASDTLAMGVLQALRDRGVRPGGLIGQGEIAVVGFDDSLPAQVTELTSVRQPLEQVAVEIVKLLDQRLAHPMTGQPGVVLTPTLSERSTS
ncbi:MAG TPA: LacI family DNA-binding transcriptional regulator [Nocardioidaceae bacterium]|nr:LacI family DNA-binding transcriptional regulator [Nocardioidaceae bacterium]